ncbi:BTB and MATH domain-containing protein [Trichinella pseudospiralis]
MIFRFAFPCDSNWNIFQIVSLFVRTETDEAQEKRVQMLDYSRVFVKAVNCVAQWPRLIVQLAIVFRMSCLFSVVLKTGVQ